MPSEIIRAQVMVPIEQPVWCCQCDNCGTIKDTESVGVSIPVGWIRAQSRQDESAGWWYFCSWVCLREFTLKQLGE